MATTVSTGFTTPGKSRGLLSVFGYRYLLSRIIRKEVQVRYRGSVLGWAWSFAKPVLQFVVYYFAMGIFLGANRRMDHYAIYLFCGLILVNFFTEAFSNGTRSLNSNAALIKKIYMPRELFPVASTLIAIVNFLPQLIVLLVIVLFYGWHPSVLGLLGILLAIVIVAILATGLGMFFGALNASFRDSQNFVDLILMVVTWGSPVFYSLTTFEALPRWAVTILQLNPVTPSVELMHYGVWQATLPVPDGITAIGLLPPGYSWYTLAAFGISVAVLFVGQLVFRRLEGRFAQDL